MNEPTTFKCKVTESQAATIRERITKAGVEVRYQEEQHGAALVLVMDCKPVYLHTVREILAGVGVRDGEDIHGN